MEKNDISGHKYLGRSLTAILAMRVRAESSSLLRNPSGGWAAPLVTPHGQSVVIKTSTPLNSEDSQPVLASRVFTCLMGSILRLGSVEALREVPLK